MKRLNENNQKLAEYALLLLLFSLFLVFSYIRLITYALTFSYYGELMHTLSKIITFLTETAFLTAAIGAFSGAAGGALIIHKYEKGLRKKQDLAYLNRALGILAAITNTLITIKRDYSIPQVEELNNIRNDWNANKTKVENTGTRKSLEISVDKIFSLASPLNLPIKNLTEMLMKFSKAGPKTFLLVSQLEGSYLRLENAINQKNIHIQKNKEDPRPPNEKVPICLGLVNENGTINSVIPDLIKLIQHEIDFSLSLTQKIEKLLVAIGQGKVFMPNGVVELKTTESAKQYLPP